MRKPKRENFETRKDWLRAKQKMAEHINKIRREKAIWVLYEKALQKQINDNL